MQTAGNHRICTRCYYKLSQLYMPYSKGPRMFYSSHVTNWGSKKVRKSFLDFFCNKNGHKYVKPSSIIPGKDQGTYFTNAGMVQFKPIFLGTCPSGSELSSYTRATNSQKCIRVGGKHSDLEDVGRDLTHQTLFEMLGSWSFGDYFKREACVMAIDLLVNVYKLPRNRLYFTYFGGDSVLGLQPDLECREMWRELGVRENHILAFGMKDNFWDMGDSGPCGPCTEIHFDHIGNRNAAPLVNMGSPEVVEIWNLVFMQYNRQKDGALLPLSSNHVDTGMGLERICAVLSGTMSNYNTDLFLPMFDVIHKMTNVPAYGGKTGVADVDRLDTAYRIIADHTRMATVCISDGLLPGRMDLEHKLRSVIYRALYQCHEVLHGETGLMGKLVQPVVDSLGDAFPEISVHAGKVRDVLDITEQRYLHAHSVGIKNFEKLLKKNPQITSLTGEHIERLHDGYYGNSMSLDLIELIANAHNIHVCPEDINQVMEKYKVTSIHTVEVEYPWLTGELLNDLISGNIPVTNDEVKYQYTVSGGKYEFPNLSSIVICLLNENNKMVDKLSVGNKVGIIVDRTQFYAEKGGQKGDKGVMKTQTGTAVITDTQSNHGYVIHIGTVTDGYLETSHPVTMVMDEDHRVCCMRNHTATHLVNAALRQVLGPNVCQRGSAVQEDKLTFDFSCVASVSDKDVFEIENSVKATIQQKLPMGRQLKPLQEALHTSGVVSLENVMYPNEVFVVSVESESGDSVCASAELCGGTHVLNTGDLEHFCVTSLTGGTSGTKTVVCLTGEYAKKAIEAGEGIRQLYADLESAVRENTNISQCTALQKHVNLILGQDVLPKLVKDEITQKMDLIGIDINIALNKQAFTNLELDLKNKMADDSDFFVQHFTMKVLQKTNKLMKSLAVTKPMMLVVDTSNNTVAYIAGPQSLEGRLESVDSFKAAVGGRISQSEKEYHVVSLKGRHTQLFMETANKILTDYCKRQNKAAQS